MGGTRGTFPSSPPPRPFAEVYVPPGAPPICLLILKVFVYFVGLLSFHLFDCIFICKFVYFAPIECASLTRTLRPVKVREFVFFMRGPKDV